MRLAALCLAVGSLLTPFAVGQTSASGVGQQPSSPAQISAAPRVYLQAQSKGSNQNAARDQSMEMSKDFEQVCPSVRVTINQQMADYTVLLNHIEVGLFVRDNQFQLADKNGDLLSKTKEGGSIRGGVKKVCDLILANWAKIKEQAPASDPVVAAAPAPEPSAPAPAATAQLAIGSTPDGAEIEIDGGFVGNTPSSIDQTSGEHMITIHKKGFKNWERKVKVSGGNVSLYAELEPVAQ